MKTKSRSQKQPKKAIHKQQISAEEARLEQENGQLTELLNLIQEQLERGSWRPETKSLWEVACSVLYWLKLAHKDHPVINAITAHEEKLRQYYCTSDVIKSRYRSKVEEHAEQLCWQMAHVYLIVGFLMGIRALGKFGVSLDLPKAISAYRLAPAYQKPMTKEESERDVEAWARWN